MWILGLKGLMGVRIPPVHKHVELREKLSDFLLPGTNRTVWYNDM